MSGTTWQVESVHHVVDGDTVRLIRSRVVEIDGRSYRLTDENPKGVPIRLTWLDSPERGDHPGWEQAKADLSNWVLDRSVFVQSEGGYRPNGLRVVCYESGGWDRIMGDLLDMDGASASQWMMCEKGWEPYVAGR